MKNLKLKLGKQAEKIVKKNTVEDLKIKSTIIASDMAHNVGRKVEDKIVDTIATNIVNMTFSAIYECTNLEIFKPKQK